MHSKGSPASLRTLPSHSGLLTTTKVILSAPLPRVYEETGGGKVVPVSASQAGGAGVVLPIGGTDFNAEELAKISKDTGKKLESEVLAPMERWMNAYNLVQVQQDASGQREAVAAAAAIGCSCRQSLQSVVRLLPCPSLPDPCRTA